MLNQKIKSDNFTLHTISKRFDKIACGFISTTFGFFSGYWKIRISDQGKEKTTFVCRFETFRFELMPFGLMNAPSTFQRKKDGLLGRFSFVKEYLVDVFLFSEKGQQQFQ